jgi:hypothetical protein
MDEATTQAFNSCLSLICAKSDEERLAGLTIAARILPQPPSIQAIDQLWTALMQGELVIDSFFPPFIRKDEHTKKSCMNQLKIEMPNI